MKDSNALEKILTWTMLIYLVIMVSKICMTLYP